LLSVGVTQNYELYQLDVNNSFLHGDLDEEVHTTPLPSFSASSPRKVCIMVSKLSSTLSAYIFLALLVLALYLQEMIPIHVKLLRPLF